MQRFEVSDGTVKRAVAKLRDEGLVETETGRGIYVVERS
jgi:DNA-binding GntR family transcriptional regulator